MSKSGKTFTIDVKVLLWLEAYAKKQRKKESAIVNELLNSAKRQSETWTCSECNGRMHISETKCWATKDCKGVKA
jgi:hypothetical protein